MSRVMLPLGPVPCHRVMSRVITHGPLAMTVVDKYSKSVLKEYGEVGKEEQTNSAIFTTSDPSQPVWRYRGDIYDSPFKKSESCSCPN